MASLGYPDSKVHGDNIGPIWDRKDPGWPHVGPMNFAIWVVFVDKLCLSMKHICIHVSHGRMALNT